MDQTSRSSEIAKKLGTGAIPNTEDIETLQEREIGTDLNRAPSGIQHTALYVCNNPDRRG